MLWAYWSVDHYLDDYGEAVTRSAKKLFQCRGKWTVVVELDELAVQGDLVLPVWTDADNVVVFGPPARVLGRHSEANLAVLIVQDCDEYEALDGHDGHQRRRAQLRRDVRNLRNGDDDVCVEGEELSVLLALFSVD